MNDEIIGRFARLFRGNQRSHGAYRPPSAKSKESLSTVREPPSTEDYQAHIAGEIGLGIVPITDDHTCWFGVIDVDAHGDAPDIDLKELEALVREKDLPLTVCRSKSGGAHLYAFGSEPLPAKLLRSALAKWAERIGHGGCEVFPKQDHLPTDSDGQRQLGNWINLCWFDSANPDCLRYTVEGGKRIPLEYFLDVAESRKISAAMLVERSADEHAEAPPCIQRIISNGVGHGQRNEALFNLVVYLKQAYPETWKDKAFDLNARVFDEPLTHAEAKKTITSAGRRDYRYRCKEEPCRSLCKSAICITRKFGITPDEKNEMEMGKPPQFGPLEKINTDPPRWHLYVDGVKLSLTTTDLMDYRQVRVAVAEELTRLIAPMKNDQWQGMLHKLMSEATELEAPEEASTRGYIRNRLNEFFRRADLDSEGTDKKDREALLLGSPIVQINESGIRCVYFRAQDFIDYLKKNRAEELKGPNLWMALRELGVEHAKLRVGKTVVPVWFTAIENADQFHLSDPEINTEI